MVVLRFYFVLATLSYSISTAFVKSVSNSSLLTFLKGDSFTRNGRRCHDFCTPDWCYNGGTCLTDETTCIGTCVCTAVYTGPRCQTKRFIDPALLTSFLNALSNDSGTGGTSIKDKYGVNGPKKNRTKELSNRVLAMLHGISHIDDGKKLDKEDHDLIFGHEHLNSAVEPVRGNVTAHDSYSYNLSMNECLLTCQNGDCIKINERYKCKHRIDGTITEKERTCGPGFVCVHGVCDFEAKRNNSYDCICESNYVGQFCDYECPFDCGKHGFCDYDVSGSLYKCFCQWNYTGYNCSELIPIETELASHPRRISFHWYVLGASVTIVFLILVGTFLAGYFLWKRRLVFVLKIVHFFQEYEDDDGKEFDAFVSYKSTERDERFVLTQLFPRLEGSSKFKLCLHFRDFEPGEAIANNIVRAIENSRRTIMVLSPSYVKSEWCRMEYQKAQHEMLKLKHKIIPIVLEDISEVRDIDTNLKSILDSVTYLEWPGIDNDKKMERFWTKLELSLPKKSSSSSSTSLSSELSPPLSDLPATIISESLPSDSTTPSGRHKPPLTLSISSETDSSTPESVELRKSSKRLERQRKTFRYFIDRFVCSRSSFSRQDSNSSQTALVDAETVGSRSSCDSMSESNLTESTESICSTPGTAHTYLDETTGETYEPSSYFSLYTNKSKEKTVGFCEKDHCEGIMCKNCLKVDKGNSDDLHIIESNNFIDHGHFNKNDVCNICYNKAPCSDNNRVEISPVEGSDQIRIRRLAGSGGCRNCLHELSRDSVYRGSLKNRKEAVNRELSLLNRSGTLPRNFRSKVLARAIPECDERSIYSNRATVCESGTICSSSDSSNFSNTTVVTDLDLGNSFSYNGMSRYIDVYESI